VLISSTPALLKRRSESEARDAREPTAKSTKESEMIGYDHAQHQPTPRGGGFWRSRWGIALIAFLAAAGFLLVYEHRAHLLTGNGSLVALLLLCVSVHFFMHGGHGATVARGGARIRKEVGHDR